MSIHEEWLKFEQEALPAHTEPALKIIAKQAFFQGSGAAAAEIMEATKDAIEERITAEEATKRINGVVSSIRFALACVVSERNNYVQRVFKAAQKKKEAQ